MSPFTRELSPEFDESGEFRKAQLRLKDGRDLVIRPAVPEDRPGLEKMFRSCSSETLYTRFLSPGLGVPLRYLDRLMRHNPPAVLSLVADAETEAGRMIVALMNFVETEPGAHGEIAIVVEDDFQNCGLGSGMLQCLLELARKRGVRKFVADIDAGNRRVFHLIKSSELPARINIYQGVAHVELDMAPRAGK
jgi:GNAT superfamily N-acetyltransferase